MLLTLLLVTVLDIFHRATAVEKQMKMIVAGTKAAATKVEGIDVDAVIDRAMEKADEELQKINNV